MVGEKAVGELAEGVGVKQRRADVAELGGGEDPGVDERCLDRSERANLQV